MTVDPRVVDAEKAAVRDVLTQLNQAVRDSQYTYQQVAEMLGISEKTLADTLLMKTEHPCITLNMVARLCSALGFQLYMWVDDGDNTDEEG